MEACLAFPNNLLLTELSVHQVLRDTTHRPQVPPQCYFAIKAQGTITKMFYLNLSI